MLAGSWPTFGGDDARSGHASGFIGGALPVPTWSLSAPIGTLFEPIAVADGRVYGVSNQPSSSSDDQVVAYDLEGTPLWRQAVSDALDVTAPTVEDGSVYLQRINSGDADVLALDAVSGAIVWTTPFASQWSHDWAPLVFDGHVVVGGAAQADLNSADRGGAGFDHGGTKENGGGSATERARPRSALAGCAKRPADAATTDRTCSSRRRRRPTAPGSRSSASVQLTRV